MYADEEEKVAGRSLTIEDQVVPKYYEQPIQRDWRNQYAKEPLNDQSQFEQTNLDYYIDKRNGKRFKRLVHIYCQ